MLLRYIIIIAILLGGMFASIATKKLTVDAAICGSILGFLIFIGAGFTGIIIMTVFFLTGTLATSHKLSFKQQIGVAEQHKGKRKSSQVLANAGAAALLGLVALIEGNSIIIQILTAACFASATADTLSSELGNVYGKRFYNILSFKKDERGLDGVISLEGTLIGVAGSLFIAIIALIGFHLSLYQTIVIVVAGTVGNLSDSLLGATLERKGYIKNDLVNFLNTFIACIIAWLLI